MNLQSINRLVQECRQAMESLYHRPVFDEWIVVHFASGKVAVVSYEGPRRGAFEKHLHADASLLYGEIVGRDFAAGDFEFVDDAKGTRFDACIKLGKDVYVLCNNTYGSMMQIRQDLRWREAQKPFLSLTEKVRSDPLVFDGAPSL